jgi:hypothetical protein
MDTVPQITGFYVTDTNNQRIRRVEYSALDFGKIPAGSTSAAMPITLGNSGSADDIISVLQLSGTAFHIVSGGSCPSTLPFSITPGTSCIVNVAFTPAATGAYAERATLSDNAPGSPQTVIATGVGVLNSTVLQIAAQPASPVYGDKITFLATVTRTAPASVALPTGRIAFANGGTQIGTKTVSQNTAQVSQTLLPAGSYPIAAGYDGDALYASSAANLIVIVAKATPTITLVSSPSPPTDGMPLALTASVQFAAAVPTGDVVFLDGTSILGTVALTPEGVATFNVASLGSGTHAITARYEGDPNFNAVSSSDLGSGSGSFTLAASGATANGTSDTFTITVTPVGGFNQTVALSCSNLPDHANCGFSPSSVTLNGTNSATSSMTITTQASCSNSGGNATFNGSILLPCIFFFGFCSRRKRLRAALFAACLFVIGAGCAGQRLNCFTSQGSYTVNIVGTSKVGSTTVTNTTAVTFTVGGSAGVISNIVKR